MSMINKYPNFSKLELSHQKAVEGFTSKFEPYSDFNFLSLYAWNIDGSAEISMLEDNLVIRLPDYIDGSPVLSILGENNLNEAINKLLKTSLRLKLIPQTVISNLADPDSLGVVEDEDNHDYVYDLALQAALAGGKFKKKRNKLNGFLKTYEGKWQLNRVERVDKSKIAELQNVFHHWVAEREKDPEEIENEKKAIERMLEKLEDFSLEVYEVLIDGVVAGFSINQVLPGGYVMCHFQKCLHNYRHIDTFLTHETAKRLLKKGCIYANWEQDLGIEGMRALKQSYQPVKMLKKYIIL